MKSMNLLRVMPVKTQIEWPSNGFIGENSSENTNEVNEIIACNAWLR